MTTLLKRILEKYWLLIIKKVPTIKTVRRIKRKAVFKQMAFETAIRNPERYVGLLTALKNYQNKVLDDKHLLEIVSFLYLIGEVSSPEVVITDTSTIGSIKNDVIQVNKTRRADGGFPAGYASRFWTYMRTLSELGMVYAQYNKKFKYAEISKKLLSGDLDEQEVYSIQAMKYNRNSPYRNVSNDFNYFVFILKVLLYLKKENKKLSYEQFIVSTFSQDGNVKRFIKLITSNKFKDYESVFRFLKKNYKVTTKFNTVIKDYPDVVKRLLLISGFISIRYSGKIFIQINENKEDYIKELLEVDFKLSGDEKIDASDYFNKLNSYDSKYIPIAIKHRIDDRIDGKEYANKIFNIIKSYKIDEKTICDLILNVDNRRTSIISEFQEIPAPLQLEFYIAILVALKYGSMYAIRPNYKIDHIGKPYSHAPGNKGDIDVYSLDKYWLIEVTLIRNKTQQLNSETTALIRHLNINGEFKDRSHKYLSFIAPAIHKDTKRYFDYEIINSKLPGKNINIKTYNVKDFIKVTISKNNIKDMEDYTEKITSNFFSKIP